MINRAKQQGAAIIVALFVTTLVAIAAIAMIERLRVDLRRTQLLLNDTKANLYVEGSVAWAMEQLNNNWKNKKNNKMIDATPIQSPPQKMEDATITSVIYDAEGLFNLNNVVKPESIDKFILLLRAVQPDVNTETIRNIAEGIRDWVSPGPQKTALDDYYFKQNPPYRAPHRPMVSISELTLVKGMTPALFNALSPYITALPEQTKINVTSAPVPVLMTLNPTLSKESAKAIENYRKTNPFHTTQLFMQYDVVKNHPIKEAEISVNSNYFLVKTSVKVGNQETIRYTMLQRTIKNSKPYEVVVWQSKGTL